MDEKVLVNVRIVETRRRRLTGNRDFRNRGNLSGKSAAVQLSDVRMAAV
jgi:hypothetical protein